MVNKSRDCVGSTKFICKVKIRNKLFSILLMFMPLFIIACGSNRLEEKISEIAQNKDLQNKASFDELSDMIVADKDSYAAFLTDDGKIDIAKLQKSIDLIGKGIADDFHWDISKYAITKPLQLTVMLERSGSMVGYDNISTSGNFKRTLNELINRFPHRSDNANPISIVNDAVYPFTGRFEDFIQDRDIFKTTANVGNASYTDFQKIFEYALADSVPERITVLITDMIYSPQHSDNATPEKIFNESGSLATNVFKSHAEKDAIIVKLNSDFVGPYYPYNTPNQGFEFRGNRPYYLIITGNPAALSMLYEDSRYASFADFKSLPGYEAEYHFYRGDGANVAYYSVLPRNKSNYGTFNIDRSNGDSGANAISDISPDATSQKFSFDVAIDLSHVKADSAYIANPANYKTNADGIFYVEKIEPVNADKINVRNKRYLKNATHLITIVGEAKGINTELTVSLLNNLPEWISQSSSENDINIHGKNFQTTTFGLKPFVEGIYQAFYGNATDPVSAKFTISIK